MYNKVIFIYTDGRGINKLSITAQADVNGNINLPLRLPNKVLLCYGSNKIYEPFVYINYWVVHCMYVNGEKVQSGEELTFDVIYI